MLENFQLGAGSQRAAETISITHLGTTTSLSCSVISELNSASGARYSQSDIRRCASLYAFRQSCFLQGNKLTENSSAAYLNVLKVHALQVRQIQLELCCGFTLIFNIQGLQQKRIGLVEFNRLYRTAGQR